MGNFPFYRHREPRFLTEEHFVLEYKQKSFPFPKIILFHMLINRLKPMNIVSGLFKLWSVCTMWKMVGVCSCTQIFLHKCYQKCGSNSVPPQFNSSCKVLLLLQTPETQEVLSGFKSIIFICLYSAFCSREKVLEMSAISLGTATIHKLFSTPVTHKERVGKKICLDAFKLSQIRLRKVWMQSTCRQDDVREELVFPFLLGSGNDFWILHSFLIYSPTTSGRNEVRCHLQPTGAEQGLLQSTAYFWCDSVLTALWDIPAFKSLQAWHANSCFTQSLFYHLKVLWRSGSW